MQIPQVTRRLLLRDYIQRSLYDPLHGYFSHATPPVLTHESGVQLSQIPSQAAYEAAVAKVYASQRHGWMTPVELFSPYLSRAIANRIESVAPPGNGRINIIEIGAGRGTLASDILRHWSCNAPDLLARTTYNIIEISSTLAGMQSKILRNWIDDRRAFIYNADALQWFGSMSESSELQDKFQGSHCHIIGMEVLDNLPHDLVRDRKGSLEQAEVLFSESDMNGSTRNQSVEWTSEIDEVTYETIMTSGLLNDDVQSDDSSTPVVPQSSVFDHFRSQFEGLLGGGVQDVYVPTVSYQLLKEITSSLPQAHITLGDFHSLPGASPGLNGPVVQRVEGGTAIVYDSVHGAPFGRVDVMFPTNFTHLLRGHRELYRSQSYSSFSRALSQQNFFYEYATDADKEESTCEDGYNPILQNFGNASFLLTDVSEGGFP